MLGLRCDVRASLVAELRLSRWGVQAQLPWGMWSLSFPSQGSNPHPLHWKADSQSLNPKGSPCLKFLTTANNKLPVNDKTSLCDRYYVWLFCVLFHLILVTSLFSSVTQSFLTLCDPMDCGMPGFPVHQQFPELLQTHVHRIVDDIQPSHPLSSPSPPAFNLS